MENRNNIEVLIIDDSYVNRQFIKYLLEENNYTIIEAGDGGEALDILCAHTPDVIILDLLMPKMDGIETLKNIRDQGFKYPILILTANINESDRTRCEELGVSGFIKKPTNGKEIINLIQKVTLHNTNNIRTP